MWMSEEHLTPCFSTSPRLVFKKETGIYLVDRCPFDIAHSTLIIPEAKVRKKTILPKQK